jgi:hypothetical protein
MASSRDNIVTLGALNVAADSEYCILARRCRFSPARSIRSSSEDRLE